MDDTIINNVNAGSELNYQIELQQIEAQFLELKMRFDTLQKENAHLKKENNQLKRMPLFVAVVVDMLGDGVIYLRQQGNNQEYLTHIDEDLYRTLKPGTKVAVNNSLSVVRIVGNIFDARIRVMELDASPDVSFDQIGGLAEQIEEVREAVEYPLTRPEIFLQVGVEPPKGILLHGSPGTGKTLIAKAVAHEAKATFIRMSGSELVHKFIGEGAQLVRELFTLARERAPSIIFIDEIDAVGSIRTNDGTSGSAEVQRTMMQLLAEMDGFNNRGDVRIMAATNRVDMLDPALLRPGRFDRVIEIPLPDKGSRRSILSIHSKNMTLSNVDIDLLSEMTETFTGAELQSVCREAGMMAVRKKASAIEQQDFIAAIRKIRTDTATDERMFT
ncbi:proteasome-activating nucleotidase [Methanosphaerula subterraneus]|uniref:proteasome-activating nucleotidase n=1 Tax=Methanosphaerula subterraneus TaxID=3350244 RepID=UPI003F86417C